MTPEKCREVLDFYKKNLVNFFAGKCGESTVDLKITPAKYPEDEKADLYSFMLHMLMGNIEGDAKRRILAHLLFMLNEMERFLNEGRMEKFHRWLGFIQATCWLSGYQTIEDLKNLNKT